MKTRRKALSGDDQQKNKMIQDIKKQYKSELENLEMRCWNLAKNSKFQKSLQK